MIIALASPRVASSLEDGLTRIQRLIADSGAQGAGIVCFPEAYLRDAEVTAGTSSVAV